MKENSPVLLNSLTVLRKRWRIVLAVFAGIFGLVFISTVTATRQYQGEVQIIIERVESDELSGGSRYQPKDPEFEKTQFQLIRSHSVASRVVDMLDLGQGIEAIEYPDGLPWGSHLRKTIAGWASGVKDFLSFSSEETEEASPVENSISAQVASQLSRNVRVRSVQGSNITSIAYTSPNPEFAATVSNTYVRAYLEETLDMKMDATRRNLEWMTEKAEGERLKLQATEKRLQKYMESQDLVTLEDRVTIIPEKLAQLGRDLVRAESKTKESQLLYDKVKSVSGDIDAAETVLSISEGSSLDLLRAQILRAEQNNMELSSKYGSKHPVMLKAVGDLNILKKKRRQEVARITQKVRNQYELALSTENSIRAQLNQTKLEALELNEKYVQYSVLKREIETNRQLYDALLTKIKDQSITGETRPVNIWVVENAKVPVAPVKPMVALNLMLGLVVGLCCGVTSALVVNHLDNRIKSAEGVSEALGAPVLGSVLFNQQTEKMGEIVRLAPRSEYAESYNELRTTLLLSAAEAPPKRILISSSIAGEGKTTTATNLALTMAKAGSRVVLLDADLRKPSVHKVFKLRNKFGLSSYLAGAAGKSILNKSSHHNLVVVTAGPIPPNPYGLLNSTRMNTLLQSLEQDFDVIICDSPPILSVADSRVLSQVFDGLILVTRAGKTTYPMAQNSLKLLRDVNARLLGLLVNAVKVCDREEYYRYYASYIDETARTEGVGS